MISECFQKINGIAEKRNKKFLDFFNSVKDSLVSDFMKKKNDFIIKQCANCQNLFIPEKSDKQYCDRLYKDTGKTCKEIGAINKHKEKIANSKIYQEYNREYKRMHGLHYNHLKEFKEKQFKEWSKKAIELRNTYTDDRLEEFKIELKKLSEIYWKNNKS